MWTMYSGLNPFSKQRKYFGGGVGGERGKRGKREGGGCLV